MKIKYLGTAAAEGIPAVFCNCETCRKALQLGGKNIMTRSQALIDDSLLVDFGSDTFSHFLAMGKTMYDVKNVLITHSHTDHLSLDEFDARCGSSAYGIITEKLNVYTSAKVIHRIKKCIKVRKQRYARIKQRVNFVPMKYFKPFVVDGFTVTPLPAMHARTEKAFLFLIEKDGKTLFYGNDTGVFSEKIDRYLVNNGKHIDFFSIDCTKGEVSTPFYGHLDMMQGAAIFDRFLRLGIVDDKTKKYFTHFSHNARMVYDELVIAAEKYGFKVTCDGLTCEF